MKELLNKLINHSRKTIIEFFIKTALYLIVDLWLNIAYANRLPIYHYLILFIIIRNYPEVTFFYLGLLTFFTRTFDYITKSVNSTLYYQRIESYLNETHKVLLGNSFGKIIDVLGSKSMVQATGTVIVKGAGAILVADYVLFGTVFGQVFNIRVLESVGVLPERAQDMTFSQKSLLQIGIEGFSGYSQTETKIQGSEISVEEAEKAVEDLLRCLKKDK